MIPQATRASRDGLGEVGSPGTQFRHGLAAPRSESLLRTWGHSNPSGAFSGELSARSVGPGQDELQSPLFQNQHKALLLALKYELFLSTMVTLGLP